MTLEKLKYGILTELGKVWYGFPLKFDVTENKDGFVVSSGKDILEIKKSEIRDEKDTYINMGRRIAGRLVCCWNSIAEKEIGRMEAKEMKNIIINVQKEME